MAKISIYYNRLASHANSINLHQELKKHLFRHDVTIKSFPDLSSLNTSLNLEVTTETEYIFAIGGDGTANTMLQQLAGKKIKLFIIPAGTANDLAGELGIKRSLQQIIQIFQNKTTSRVDLIEINGKLMATNGGIGIPTKIAAQINKLRKQIPGFKFLMRMCKSHIYSLFLVKELIWSKITKYEITLSSPDLAGETITIKTPMVLINNQQMLAGTFPVAPETHNNDGLFNVTIFKHDNKFDLIRTIFNIKRGKYPTNDLNLLNFETNKIDIASAGTQPIAFFGDGEILDNSCNFNISISNKKIDLFCSTGASIEERSYSLDAIESV